MTLQHERVGRVLRASRTGSTRDSPDVARSIEGHGRAVEH